MKFKLSLLAISIFLLVTACSEEDKAVVAEKPGHPVIENKEDLGETPPHLKVDVDGIEISSIRGGYSWSYFDEKENAMATIEKESFSPLELAENQEGPSVNGKAVIDLKFEKEPDSYEVQIWNSDGDEKGPFSEIVLDESSGKTVYQVIAHWEQGTGTYVFSLDIQ